MNINTPTRIGGNGNFLNSIQITNYNVDKNHQESEIAKNIVPRIDIQLSENTILYIIIGILTTVVVILLLLLFKKKQVKRNDVVADKEIQLSNIELGVTIADKFGKLFFLNCLFFTIILQLPNYYYSGNY